MAGQSTFLWPRIKPDTLTVHLTDLNQKNDVHIAKLNKGDLSLFHTTNSSWCERPLKVKSNGTA
jgi:hypothetical protein